MNKKIEATVILAKCSKTGQVYGNRIEKKNDGKWHFTWAFKIDESKAKKEGFDKSNIKGEVCMDAEYQGCPYCHSKGWFNCGDCEMLNCWDCETNNVECKWCGNKGKLSSPTEEFELKGGEM